MRIELISLFTELFEPFVRTGLVGRAARSEIIDFCFLNPRDYTQDKHRSVDDTPYGGGGGMVLRPEPYLAAMEAGSTPPAHRILLTPQGDPFAQHDAERLSKKPSLAFVCGRYEGFDERIRTAVDEELSLGDYVLLGGELAAMAMIEATIRLLPGVLGNQQSAVDESHTTGLLEYPQYTRPLSFRGQEVPEVLRSGDHAAIQRWRRQQALGRTSQRRPELLKQRELSPEDKSLLTAFLAAQRRQADEAPD